MVSTSEITGILTCLWSEMIRLRRHDVVLFLHPEITLPYVTKSRACYLS